jgi:uncharacterized membrane protein
MENTPYSAQGAAAAPVSGEGMISGAIHTGWETFKANLGLFIGMFFVFAFIQGLVNGIINQTSDPGQTANGFLSFVWFVVQRVITAGFLYTALKAVRKEEVNFNGLFSGLQKSKDIILAAFIVTVGLAIGMVLLIVPGVIFGLGINLYLLLIMDKNAEGIDSLKKSWAIMNGHKGEFLLLVLALIGINILGLLALVVGLFVTIPLSYVIIAAYYNRLTSV